MRLSQSQLKKKIDSLDIDQFYLGDFKKRKNEILNILDERVDLINKYSKSFK
jgi:hypothetical protein